MDRAWNWFPIEDLTLYLTLYPQTHFLHFCPHPALCSNPNLTCRT